MSNIFLETAEQDKEHAKMWFKEFHGIGDTAENLEDAAAGENYEWTEMYKRMAEEAREEGFEELAAKFEEMCIRDRIRILQKRYQQQKRRKIPRKVRIRQRHPTERRNRRRKWK